VDALCGPDRIRTFGPANDLARKHEKTALTCVGTGFERGPKWTTIEPRWIAAANAGWRDAVQVLQLTRTVTAGHNR